MEIEKETVQPFCTARGSVGPLERQGEKTPGILDMLVVGNEPNRLRQPVERLFHASCPHCCRGVHLHSNMRPEHVEVCRPMATEQRMRS
jgi:hypothetical protein